MPLEVFYSYAHEDETLRKELEKHLVILRRRGLIEDWNDRRIGAGGEWDKEINAHVRSAHIILFLVSSDFLASDYIYDVEMKLALERQARHEAVVIPIILRPLNWSGAPFAKLQALPRDGKAVTTWINQDEAFADVARGIEEVVQRFAATKQVERQFTDSKVVDKYVPKPRILDAAIPSHIVKDVATQLLVLIHLPDSAGLKGVLQAEDAEAKPEDVRSKPFNVVFPLTPDGRPGPLKTMVKVTSPDFSPRSKLRMCLFLPTQIAMLPSFS